MRKFYLILFVVILSVKDLVSQTVGVEAIIGYSSYRMEGLKDFLIFQRDEALMPVKITDNFPTQIHPGVQFFLVFEDTDVGVRYSHYSTGGRLHYKDYSGETRLDLIMSGNSVGVFGRMHLVSGKRFKFKGSLGASAYLTSGQLEAFSTIGEESSEERINLATTSLGLELSIEPSYTIADFCSIGLRVGGAFDLGGDLHLANNKDAILLDEDDNPITIDWSGFRGELFLGFTF